MLETPTLALNAGGAVVTFFYHMFGDTIGSLWVDACAVADGGGTNCTTLWSQTGQQHTSITAAWTQVTLHVAEVSV